jgi:DNA-binding MarR family transcriptional regulator
LRDAELIRYLVLAAQREGNRLLANDLRGVGLSPAQAEVISILGEHEPLTLTGLGEMLVCESGSNPSRLIDRLVGAGLVERRTGTQDRRQVTLSLTAAGREARAAVSAAESRLYEAVDAAMTATDVVQLLDILGRFGANSPSALALKARLAAESASRDLRP